MLKLEIEYLKSGNLIIVFLKFKTHGKLSFQKLAPESDEDPIKNLQTLGYELISIKKHEMGMW